MLVLFYLSYVSLVFFYIVLIIFLIRFIKYAFFQKESTDKLIWLKMTLCMAAAVSVSGICRILMHSATVWTYTIVIANVIVMIMHLIAITVLKKKLH